MGRPRPKVNGRLIRVHTVEVEPTMHGLGRPREQRNLFGSSSLVSGNYS